MAATSISWTQYAFNLVWGCTPVSSGCAHCFAERIANAKQKSTMWHADGLRRTQSTRYWGQPIAWNRAAVKKGERRSVFASPMCDLFEQHETVKRELAKLWPLIVETPALNWLLLTKRPECIVASLPEGGLPSNVWLGVSVENQSSAHRIATLANIKATVLFVSYEPALGPLKFDVRLVDWLIYGGESGPNFRRDDPQWARDWERRCVENDVPYFYKQGAGLRPEMFTALDGRVIQQFPKQACIVEPAPPMKPVPSEPTLFDVGNPQMLPFHKRW